MDNGNGTRSCRRQGARGRLITSLVGKASDAQCTQLGTAGAGFHHLNYEYDFSSLLSGIDDHSETIAGAPNFHVVFSYDRLNQLVGVEQGGTQFGFDYDSIQNLTQRTVTAEVSSSATELPTGDFGYGDAGAGPNMLTSAGGEAFDYDELGQLQRHRRVSG